MSQTASRIAPLQPPYPPEIQQQFDRIMRGAPPLLLFRTMAGHARAWDKFRGGSLLDKGPLSLREREIVIDRTCARTGCEYEWGVHVATFAEAARLTDEQVRATVLGEAGVKLTFVNVQFPLSLYACAASWVFVMTMLDTTWHRLWLSPKSPSTGEAIRSATATGSGDPPRPGPTGEP